MTMPTTDDLRTAHRGAAAAHESAQNRFARLDRIIAAMALIDESVADCPDLTDADRMALDEIDNALAFAKLTANRRRLAVELTHLRAAADAARKAYDDAPELAT